jgi:tyrosyl-tRNA synthetase
MDQQPAPSVPRPTAAGTPTASALGAIRSRTVDLVSEEELATKMDRAAAAGRTLRIKLGADPSAPDLHLGHVVVLNKLRQFQDLGHTVVFIIGDFTGMIGDPSGRSQTRKPLSREDVNRNAQTYREQVFRILDPDRTEIRFNSEWTSLLTFEDVIRLSSRVTVAQMLARDDFAKRYGQNQPISLVEFMYPLVQAHDSVQVEADVEVGGTDQLFNLLLGRELQKAFGQEPQVVLTLPLLEGLDGKQKMSKSLGNTVGVTDPPHDMFGKLMSVSDELMWRYFELVLCWEGAEIAALRGRHPREVKDELARAIVDRFHGAGAGAAASAEFVRIFREKSPPTDMAEIALTDADLRDGRIGILTLLTKAGLTSSNSEARRLIQQGAVRLDDQRIDDPTLSLPPSDQSVLRCGKRGFARIRLP